MLECLESIFLSAVPKSLLHSKQDSKHATALSALCFLPFSSWK